MENFEETKFCVYCKEPIAEGEPYMTEPRDDYTVHYHLSCFKLMYQCSIEDCLDGEIYI